MSPCITGRPWTAEEDALLRRDVARLGSARLATTIDRTVWAVRTRAHRLGIRQAPHWNDIERQRMRNMWGEYPLHVIAAKLERSQRGCFTEAMRIGLGVVPAGFEVVADAVKRTGFHWTTLRMIFEWAGVEARRPPRRPATAPRRTWIVDKFDVDEAVRAWLATETLQSAARRRGMCAETLAKRLARVEGVPPKPAGKKHWRIPTEVIDLATGTTVTKARAVK